MRYPILDDLNGLFLLSLCRAACKNGFSGFTFAENLLRPQSSNKKPKLYKLCKGSEGEVCPNTFNSELSYIAYVTINMSSLPSCGKLFY